MGASASVELRLTRTRAQLREARGYLKAAKGSLERGVAQQRIDRLLDEYNQISRSKG